MGPDATPSPYTTGTAVSLPEAASLLAGASALLLVTHRNPDGDAVGSSTALASALRQLGKRVALACPDPLPASLLAIPGAEAMQTQMPEGAWDLIVCIDVSDPQLLAPFPASAPGYLAQRRSLCVDHHVSNGNYAHSNLVDVAAAAAAEIVLDLVRELGVRVDATLATQLLYGIVNDTHSFQNSNTTPETLRRSADLVEAGADLPRIVQELILARRVQGARLWALVLPTLILEDGARVAFLTVSLEALARAEATMEDADGLVDFLRNIRGVDLAVLCKQQGPEFYRLSLRTTDAVDAAAIAATFGGGGHRRAAGCDLAGTLDQVRARILEAYARVRVSGEKR